jgi:hypothetical protein
MNALVSALKLDPDSVDRIKERVAGVSVASAQNAVAAACLVFSHSLADVAVEELCMIAADFDRAYWVRLIETRSLTIRQLSQQNINDVLRNEIRKKIRILSLPRKMNHLLRHAGEHCRVEYPGFSYSRDRLAELDQIRHGLVHGEGITLQVNLRDSQEFFFQVTVYAGLVLASLLGLGMTLNSVIVEWAQVVTRQKEEMERAARPAENNTVLPPP